MNAENNFPDKWSFSLEAEFAWEEETEYALRLEVKGAHLRCWAENQLFFDEEDEGQPLLGGAAAFVHEEDHMMSQAMFVRSIEDGD